jgi:type IV secretory pathway VirB2 component (pilin)
MKKLVVNKRIVALVVLLVICVFSAAADDFGLDEKIGMVLQMLSSPWVKGIACIALIVECNRRKAGTFGNSQTSCRVDFVHDHDPGVIFWASCFPSAELFFISPATSCRRKTRTFS